MQRERKISRNSNAFLGILFALLSASFWDQSRCCTARNSEGTVVSIATEGQELTLLLSWWKVPMVQYTCHIIHKSKTHLREGKTPFKEGKTPYPSITSNLIHKYVHKRVYRCPVLGGKWIFLGCDASSYLKVYSEPMEMNVNRWGEWRARTTNKTVERASTRNHTKQPRKTNKHRTGWWSRHVPSLSLSKHSQPTGLSFKNKHLDSLEKPTTNTLFGIIIRNNPLQKAFK